MMTIAASVYDDTGAYTTVGSNAAYSAGKTSIETANGAATVVEGIATSAWCFQTALLSEPGVTYCVDSTGYKGTTAVSCDATGDCATDT